MALQHRRRDEGLLAQVALVLFVAVMNHLDVHVERVLPLEGGVALVALEGPLTCSRDKAVIGCCYLEDPVIRTTNIPLGLIVQVESTKRNSSLG